MTLLKGGSGETLKFKSLLKTTTLAIALSCSVSAVFAVTFVPPVVPCAGVARDGGTGAPTTTFISPDPAYSNSSLNGGGFVTGPQPSFSQQVPHNAGTQGGGGTKCGWNFPALHAGLLPNTTGDLVLIEGWYSIAGTNQPGAEPGFRVIIQTADGKYHASSTKLSSDHPLTEVNNNGRTLWRQIPFAANFNPPLVSGPGAQCVKVAWGFYGNSSCQLINQIIPPSSTTHNTGYDFLDGSDNFVINDPLFGGTAYTFSINPIVDTKFNFELSGPNN